MDLTKTFIITGTSGGLGSALLSYIITNTSFQAIGISRRLLQEQSVFDTKKFSFIKLDLASKKTYNNLDQLNELVLSGEIIFINNASSINPISPVGFFSLEQIEQIIDINFSFSVYISNFLLKNFSNKKITMINISSGAANKPIDNWSLYCSTKAATKMFYDVLAIENPDKNFYNIDPGVIDTKMQAQIRNSSFSQSEKFIAFKEKGLLKKPDRAAKEILTPYL